MKIAKFLPFILGVMLVLSASAYADPVPLLEDDVSALSGGIVLSWNIEQITSGENAGKWLYRYTITTDDVPGLSHWNLQVTLGVDCSDLISATGDYGSCTNSDGSTNFGTLVDDFIKFDDVPGGASEGGASFSFILPNSPVWGSALVKGGSTNPNSNSNGYAEVLTVVRPNGTSVPEPGTLFLLGTGLLGVCLFQRRRK